MQGRRLYTDDQQLFFYESPVSSWRFGFGDLKPGDYWFCFEQWWGITPDGSHANLKAHNVIENPDRSITVSPSILVKGNEVCWHGFLENGIWRECE